MERWKNIFSDPEFWFILVFNTCIAWVYGDGLISMDTIIWIYFFQSIIIGISNNLRIAWLSNYLASNLEKDGKPMKVTTKAKWFGPVFFNLHYGLFHFLYFIFLAIYSFNNGSKLDLRMVMINAGIMAINAIISTYFTIMQDKDEKPAVNDLFFTPYWRIMPMHFFLIIGITYKANPEISLPVVGSFHVFWIFLILKIFSDLIMHIIIQKSWKNPRVKLFAKYI